MLHPIHLNTENMCITIIGGGKIAFRKCRFFLTDRKQITVVSKHFISEFDTINTQVKLIHDTYKAEYIKNSLIVIAATDNPKLNLEIANYCKQHQKLINIANDSVLSNFIIPAHIRRGSLLLSTSTCGKSPSLTAKIKQELEITYDDSYEHYVNLLGEARKKILATVNDPITRKAQLNQLINLSLEELENLKRN